MLVNNNKNKLTENKSILRKFKTVDDLLNQSRLSLYGTDRSSDMDELNNKFQKLLNNEIGSITNRDTGDTSSFLSQLISTTNKRTSLDELLSSQMLNLSDNDNSALQSYIQSAYKNRFIEQNDLKEIASQLIELQEAILITRDAIISSDVVEGRMSRILDFDNIDDDEIDNATTVIEHMERKFKLQEKAKNFILPHCLETGEYYVYTIPYSHLFNTYMKQKAGSNRIYRESTLMESFEPVSDKNNKVRNGLDVFIESCYSEFMSDGKNAGVTKDEFSKDMSNILGNISICNDGVPLPILEEGWSAMKYFKESVTMEAGEDNGVPKNIFAEINKTNVTDELSKAAEGIHGSSYTSRKNDFKDITDCYFKLIDSTKLIPLEVMGTVFGYYYVLDDTISPLNGPVSNNLYGNNGNVDRQSTIIDTIATKVVSSFDKKFLKDNIKFKDAIVNCFNYYNLKENKVRFQFIPAEYITAFKIDEDENGKGTSMIKKSLFYAKLYLMLLLFKIMSIILYSNDQKINYIKQSGIDKNVANKVQEIARINQSRQINITDLFSYTALINKIGNGNTMYVPTGRSGERPIETDILAGQDIQLNNDLMEMLKNSYILGTGVPAAIVNYLNEADFAKVVEQNNTKFLGRVVNYQLDFNSGMTELYKKLMRWSTNLTDNVIENFAFSFQPPKATSNTTKADLISQHQTQSDFVVGLMYNEDDPNKGDEIKKEVKIFKQMYAEDCLPMIDFDRIRELQEKAKVNYIEQKLTPKPEDGDDGDDIGIDSELDNIHL